MLHILLNPVAGNGRALSLLPSIEAELGRRGIDYQVKRTEYAGHATLLARDAVKDGADILSCGGDGTLCEVLSGMQGSQSTLLILPCGTGNDFIKSFYPLPKDPFKALVAQLDGQSARIDFGRVNDKAFLNVAGTGFDVQVLQQAGRFKKFGSGLVPYLLGVVAALCRFRPVKAELVLDGEPMSGEYSIISIANGQYFGGGMRVAPKAEIDDGFFDVVLVKRVRKWQVALLMPTFITGHFTRLPITTVRKCRRVTLRAEGLIVNADGELIPMPGAEFSIAAGGLRVMKPAEGKN